MPVIDNIKKTRFSYISAALLLAFASICFTSCNKEDVPTTQYKATFYVGGSSADASGYTLHSYIYKDDERLYELDDNAILMGVCMMPDGLYASGYVLKDIMTTFSPTPAVWKNGGRLKLNLNSDVTVLGPIMAHNGNWICYGLAKEEDGNHGIIVENGKEVFRIKEPVQFQYLRIASSGDYYAVVSDDAGIYLWRINADTWEIVTKEDVAKDTDTYVWVPLAFHVGNRDIAIGFKKRQKEFPFEESGAYMWMNDGRGIVVEQVQVK